MATYVFINGKVVSPDQAKISVFDHGILYGNGLFETIPVHSGKPFRLEKHLERLATGARILGWPEIPSPIELAAAAETVVKENRLAAGGIRMSLYRGEGEMIPDDSTCNAITLIIAPRTLKPTAKNITWKLATSAIRRNDSSPLSSVKSTNYLDNILARKQAKARGADEALLLNSKGCVAEGSISNIFFVTASGVLVTPDISSGILPGITRSIVLEIACAEGIKVEERPVAYSEIDSFSEAFMTNSLIEIVPISAIDNSPCGKSDYSTANMLRKKYHDIVNQETNPG